MSAIPWNVITNNNQLAAPELERVAAEAQVRYVIAKLSTEHVPAVA